MCQRNYFRAVCTQGTQTYCRKSVLLSKRLKLAQYSIQKTFISKFTYKIPLYTKFHVINFIFFGRRPSLARGLFMARYVVLVLLTNFAVYHTLYYRYNSLMSTKY